MDAQTFSELARQAHQDVELLHDRLAAYQEAHNFAMNLVRKFIESDRTETGGLYRKIASMEFPFGFSKSQAEEARRVLQGPPFQFHAWTEMQRVSKDKAPRLVMKIECHPDLDKPIIKDFH